MIFNSKKATMTVLTLVLISFVTAVLTALDAPEEVITWVTGALTAVIASYNTAQGYADGKANEAAGR